MADCLLDPLDECGERPFGFDNSNEGAAGRSKDLDTSSEVRSLPGPKVSPPVDFRFCREVDEELFVWLEEKVSTDVADGGSGGRDSSG